MEIVFLEEAEKDLQEWKHIGNKKAQQKIFELIADILATPFSGIGKPELLKHDLGGKWSRRITGEDRLVYEIKDEKLLIYSLKGHYN